MLVTQASLVVATLLRHTPNMYPGSMLSCTLQLPWCKVELHEWCCTQQSARWPPAAPLPQSLMPSCLPAICPFHLP